jgi:protein-S-isoprenylcysteine O-methyltransferase Ste14
MNAARRLLAVALLGAAAISGTVSIGLFVMVPTGSLRLFQTQWPVAAVLSWDAFLSLLFFVQHSGMVRRGFRARVERFIPPWSYPAVYCIATSTVLIAFVVLWRPTGLHLLVFEGLALQIVNVVCLLAVILFIWGAIALKGFDPFGLSPIRAHLRGWEEPRPAFVAAGPYHWVRHPLYFSILVLIWFCPDLTLDRLLLNILWTAWIWIATQWEERDLQRDFGDAYRQYQKKVSMLIPWRTHTEARGARMPRSAGQTNR